MVASKQKKPKYKEAPKTQKNAAIANSPEQYYGENPSWRFSTIDIKMWSSVNDSVQKIFWNEILPKLQGWESQNWKEILLDAKKHNHSIKVEDLNPIAISRLEELMIEQNSILSLRLSGTHRIYGYIVKNVFCILWVDLDHGDNKRCVCRSRKKHT